MRTLSPPLCTLFAPLLAIAVGCDTATPPLRLARPAQAASSQSEQPAHSVDFLSGYPEALAEAHRSGKPLLMFFSAAECIYSNQMLEEAFCDQVVVRLAEDFVCVRIEADEAPEICRDFHVEAFPTVQFVSPEGSPLHRVLGKKEPETLASQMEAALRGPRARTVYRSGLSRR
jgi:thioredoxin-related protein